MEKEKEKISEVVSEIETLLKEGKRKEAVSLFQKNKKLFEDELKEKQAKKEFISTTGHSYSGWNLYFLAHLSKPGVFGTYKQWAAAGRTVVKGAGIPILVPFIGNKKKSDNKSDKADNKSDKKSDKKEKEIKYFSTKPIWHEDNTVPMKQKVA